MANVKIRIEHQKGTAEYKILITASDDVLKEVIDLAKGAFETEMMAAEYNDSVGGKTLFTFISTNEEKVKYLKSRMSVIAHRSMGINEGCLN